MRGVPTAARSEERYSPNELGPALGFRVSRLPSRRVSTLPASQVLLSLQQRLVLRMGLPGPELEARALPAAVVPLPAQLE